MIDNLELFLQVLNGEQPEAVLAPLLTDDEPWLKTAVEYVVSERLAALQTGKRAEFRIRVFDLVSSGEMESVEATVSINGEDKVVQGVKPKIAEKVLEVTPWLAESDPRFSAPLLMGELRRKYRTARMAIERR